MTCSKMLSDWRIGCRLRAANFMRALAEFVARHDDERITAEMDQVIAEVGNQTEDFTREAARQVLRQVEW